MPSVVSVPNLGDVQFPDGMSKEQISSAIKNILSKKGGEQANEDQIRNQPQADQEGNARRVSDQQEPSVGSQANVQADVQLRPQDQGQRERNDQTRLTNEGQTKDAQGGIQGPQAGQGMEGQVPARNKEEVKAGGVRPSITSKIIGAITSPMGYLSQSTLGAISGIQRAIGMDKQAEDTALMASSAVEDWARTFGGEPISGEGAGATAAKIGAGIIELPALALTGAPGVIGMLAQGFGGAKKDLYDKYKQQGLSDEEANKKSSTHAAITTAATLPAYYLGGKIAGQAADAFISESAPKLLDAAGRIGMNAVANGVASAAVRGFTAGIEGEDPIKAAKDVSLEGSIQDVLFAAHSTGEHFKEQARQGNADQASTEVSDAMLDVLAKKPEYADIANEEIQRRAKLKMADQADSAGLPITAAAVEQGNILPEAPPLAPEEAAPSLPKEEAQPPVSGAGEAPAVEPTAEAPVEAKQEMVPTPGVLPGGKEPPTMAPKVEYEKGVAELQKLRGDEKISLIDYQKVHSDVAQGIDPIEAAQRAENEYQAHKYAGSEMSKAVSSGEIPSGPKAAELYNQKYNQRLNELKPAEAQPTIPSEEQVKETSGLPTLKGVAPVGEAEVKAEGGIAQGKREGEEEVAVPEGTRVASAAYLAPDGKVYEGPDHLAAMEKAKEAGAITQKEIDAKQEPESRNTSEYGFKVTLPDGTTQVTTREVGGQAAKQSGQALVDKFVHGDKAHSNEMRMDEYNHLGEEMVSPKKFAEDPKAAVQEAIPEPTEEVLQKNQMTRSDAQALGIVPKGTARTNFLIDSVKNKIQEITDAIKYRGKNIKELRKAGVEDEANQHAAARIYVPVHVDELLGQVFGETKDIEKMRPTMDILVKDDIVGGYEDIVKQVNDLEAERAQAQAEGRPTKAIENKIETLSKRGRDIEEAHPIEQYKQEIDNASPEIQGNIERWKRHVVPDMDSLYNELKNVDPATEREGRGWKFGARLNLLSKTEEEKMASYGDLDKPMPSTSVSNYRNPNVKRDKFMQKASFLGDYSTDPVAILTNSLASRWNEVTKIRFYKALEDKGVGKIVSAGEEAPAMIGGKEVVRLPIKFPETDPKTGITRVVEQSLYVQKGLEDSVKKILDVDSRPQQNPLAKAFTGIQILGVADATAHLKNLQNITRNALGRDSAWADLTAKIPFLGQAQSVKEIADVAKEVSSKSQRTRDEKAYLAKIGALRPFYPAEGIQRFLGTHQLLHDVDTATRIILNRRYDELIKRYGAVDTESARRDFINQVGNYNRRLMGRWETLARDTGFSPFIVAGRAMNRYARKMITGDPGFQTDNVKGAIAARASQISGLAFATLIPAITNMFTTGTPFGRQGTPIGAIDFGPNYDTEDGKRRTFDVFALTGLRRGLRQFGIDSAIDGTRSGKDIRDIERDMANGFLTTKMHPWIGPAVGLGQETLTGKRFDLRTGYSQRYEARKIEGIGQYAENFRIALKQLNPLLYGVAGKGVEWAMKDVGGIPYPSEERSSKENIGLISKAVGAPQVVGEIEGALEKPVMGAVGYKESPSEAIKLANSFGEAVQFTPEQDQRFTYRRQIRDALSKGNVQSARDLYQQGFNDGILTEADKKTIGRYIKYPDKAVQKFQMLKTADEAVRVWRVATAKEQDAVADVVARKIVGSTTLRPEEKKKLINTFFSTAKPDTEAYEIAKRKKNK